MLLRICSFLQAYIEMNKKPPVRALLSIAPMLFFLACGASPEQQVGSIYEFKRDPTPQNVERLRKFLDNEVPRVRATAVNALVTLDVEDAARIAVMALEDSDEFVRATAAKLVGDQEDPNLAGFLEQRILRDPSALVRRRAAQALRRAGGPQSGEVLVSALSDPDQDVRLAVLRAVRDLAPGQGVERLIEILEQDPVWELRVQAAVALGTSSRPAARDALQAAEDDPVEFVRSAATKALVDQPPIVQPPVDGAASE